MSKFLARNRSPAIDATHPESEAFSAFKHNKSGILNHPIHRSSQLTICAAELDMATIVIGEQSRGLILELLVTDPWSRCAVGRRFVAFLPQTRSSADCMIANRGQGKGAFGFVCEAMELTGSSLSTFWSPNSGSVSSHTPTALG